jgi:hypothetical protein
MLSTVRSNSLHSLKIVLLLFLMLAMALSAFPGHAQTPAFRPAVAVGTYSGLARSEVSNTTIDSFGYVYVTGTFAGTVSFGSFTLSTSSAGDQDMFVAKLDGAGNYLWAVQGGGTSQDTGGGVAVDASGAVYVTGSFYSPTAQFGPYSVAVTYSGSPTSSTSDIFVARLDASGNWLWVSTAGGTGFDGTGPLALDTAGNLYVTGGFSGPTATFGTTTLFNSPGSAGVFELLVAKINPQGTWQWARSGGGGGQEGGYDIAVDGANNVYLTGLVQSTLGQFGPFSLPANTYSADDVLVAKLDANGTWLWAVRAGGLSIDEGNGIAVDVGGNAYVTGRFSGASATFGPFTLTNGGPLYGYGGTNEIFVAKLSSAGIWQWAVRAGGDSNDYGKDIVLDGTGRLQVVGSFTSATAQLGAVGLANTSQGTLTSGQMLYQSDVFLAHLTTSGAWLGAVGSQGLGNEYAYSLAVDAAGNASVAGSFQSATATFGGSTLPGSTTLPTGYVTLVPTVPPLTIIAGITPSSGAAGQTVTVTGSGFMGVTGVLFNGTPAASYAVQSATQLTVVVPANVTAGPISVRTAAGTGSSPTVFTPTVLATATPRTGALALHPNPAASVVYVPASLVNSHVQVLDALGRVARETTVSAAAEVSVQGLAPGLYTLRATDKQGRQYAARLGVE